jgi:phage anti-repressor protein
MNKPQSQIELVPITTRNNQLLVDARLLHKQLEITTPFHKWIQRRIGEYDFENGIEFWTNLSKNRHSKGRMTKDYILTLDMAKELAMLERNEHGKTIRRYFIEVEKRYRDWIGFVFPKLQREQTLFSDGYYFNYIELLQSCDCSIMSGSVRRRIRRNPQEFTRNQLGVILVSENYGKTIAANAITRKLNAETTQRRILAG